MYSKELCTSQTWLEDMVYNLLRYHGYEQPEDINLLEICRTFNTEVWFIQGRSRSFPHPRRAGWFVIQIDSTLSEEEQREKIAHELGHLILHCGAQPGLPELMICMQESQTNHFAEHLLVPFYMFDRLFYQVNRYEAPKYIARLFCVTEKIARQRFDRFMSRAFQRGYAHYI